MNLMELIIHEVWIKTDCKLSPDDVVLIIDNTLIVDGYDLENGKQYTVYDDGDGPYVIDEAEDCLPIYSYDSEGYKLLLR